MKNITYTIEHGADEITVKVTPNALEMESAGGLFPAVSVPWDVFDLVRNEVLEFRGKVGGFPEGDL